MDRILRGILKFRLLARAHMVKQIQLERNKPEPKAIFYTCMDRRIIVPKFTVTTIGDMFVVRNPGNIIPHSQFFPDEMPSCEPAGLEIACLMYKIKDIVVCGHSDCGAMNLLHSMSCKQTLTRTQRRASPLRSWLCSHGQSSLKKFLQMKGDFTQPMLFFGETQQRRLVAYIDPENKFSPADKLSQVNALQQIENIASYGMLSNQFEEYLHVHALWFDVHTGDVYYFSRMAKQFIVINESTFEEILAELRTYYE